MKKLTDLIVTLISNNAILYIVLSIVWNQWNPSKWYTPPTLSKVDLLIAIEIIILLLSLLIVLFQSDRD